MRIEYESTADDLIKLMQRYRRRSAAVRTAIRKRWFNGGGMACMTGVLAFALLDQLDWGWRLTIAASVLLVGGVIHWLTFRRWLSSVDRYIAAVLLGDRSSRHIVVQLDTHGVWSTADDTEGFGIPWADVLIETRPGSIDFIVDNEAQMEMMDVPDRAFADDAERARFLQHARSLQETARRLKASETKKPRG